jgi:hypothetical protein
VQIQAASASKKALVGMGYDVLREEFSGRCVAGTADYAGREESIITFDRSLDESEMSSQLGFEVGVRARYGLFSGSAAAQFASESAASEFTDVTIYSHTINFENEIFNFPGVDSGLTDAGRRARGSASGGWVSDFGCYVRALGVATVGRMGLLIAWDPASRGPAAADDLDVSNVGLYSWIGPLYTPLQVTHVKTKSPVAIPATGCPKWLDGGRDHDYVIRFGLKSGGTGSSNIQDCWLEVYEGQTKVYEIAPSGTPMRVELAPGSGSNVGETSMQDRVTIEAWEDPVGGDFWTSLFLGGQLPSKEIWRKLMTPNAPLDIFA